MILDMVGNIDYECRTIQIVETLDNLKKIHLYHQSNLQLDNNTDRFTLLKHCNVTIKIHWY